MRKWLFLFIIISFPLLHMNDNHKDAMASAKEEYFEIQRKCVMASLAHEFQTRMLVANKGEVLIFYPLYFLNSFCSQSDDPERPILEDLKNNYRVEPRLENSRYEAYKGGKNLNIYARKDWDTIGAVARDCEEWRKTTGRVACEFDGGSDTGMKPFTAFLLDVGYLKYLSQRLGFEEGKYVLVQQSKPEVVIDLDKLLTRNALARVICYHLLAQTSSLLADKYTIDCWPADNSKKTMPSYMDLDKRYRQHLSQWEKFLEGACNSRLTWTDRDFQLADKATCGPIRFDRDDDLLNEILKELNYYKEKCDFVNYFQIENYSMFLLSILRLYDVNLELDNASNKYVITPGPTDPQKFFDIVAEFTFVNDPSDIQYLKENLKSWNDSEPAPDRMGHEEFSDEGNR